jgi:predicted phosphodiesterase
MSAIERMQNALKENSKIGRVSLSEIAGVSKSVARTFLKHNKIVEPVKSKEPEVNPYSFLDNLPKIEIDRLKQSILSTPTKHITKIQSWSNSSFKFAAMGDTHIGHILSNRDWWDKACSFIAEEKCDFVLHAGDITEGMSGRPGHYYELAQVGMDAQVKEAVERISQLPVKMKAITGNHDGWAFKSVGFDPGVKIAEVIPDKFEYLGMDEADLDIGGVKIKLWHGGDGSSYALSYRTQKFIEGLTGGEKPHVLLSGHAHKSICFECRNVMVFEVGTLCGQTSWMRGKKLAAHCGFWIIEIWPDPAGGIQRIKQEWIPFFV